MARIEQIIVTDDLDGSENATTVQFGLDGTTYEIDLSQKNSDRLRKALKPFMEAARKAPAAKRKTSAASPPAHLVREWAQANGMDCPPKGRVPKELKDAYSAAH